MKIAFEANVLTSPHTGIAKSLINLIKHIKDTEIILFTNNNKKIKLDLGFKYIFIDFCGLWLYFVNICLNFLDCMKF